MLEPLSELELLNFLTYAKETRVIYGGLVKYRFWLILIFKCQYKNKRTGHRPFETETYLRVWNKRPGLNVGSF